mgnify:CR=1 FL=1
MKAKPIKNLCKVEDTQGEHQPYGKHEFYSIADQQRAEKIAFSKGKSKRKKRK